MMFKEALLRESCKMSAQGEREYQQCTIRYSLMTDFLCNWNEEACFIGKMVKIPNTIVNCSI